jgi:hypothetical protein
MEEVHALQQEFVLAFLDGALMIAANHHLQL